MICPFCTRPTTLDDFVIQPCFGPRRLIHFGCLSFLIDVDFARADYKPDNTTMEPIFVATMPKQCKWAGVLA
jgi:hypothetical protein